MALQIPAPMTLIKAPMAAAHRQVPDVNPDLEIQVLRYEHTYVGAMPSDSSGTVKMRLPLPNKHAWN
jgi:hypothetical protein